MSYMFSAHTKKGPSAMNTQSETDPLDTFAFDYKTTFILF